MDGIKIKISRSRAIHNKMVTAVTYHKDMKHLQQEWLVEYIEAVFKEKSAKKQWWDYTQHDLVAKLIEQGLDFDNVTNKTQKDSRPSYYRQDDFVSEHYTIDFNNYSVDFNNYRGCSYEGSYRGINAHFFGIYHSIDLRFMPVETAAATLLEIDNLIPQWIDTLWPDFLLEAQKDAKMKAINENTIETLVKAKLADTDIKYYIEKQSTRVKVYFNIGHKMQLEWFIAHKTFMEQMDSVIAAVKAIKNTVEITGSTFNAKRLDTDINWQ